MLPSQLGTHALLLVSERRLFLAVAHSALDSVCTHAYMCRGSATFSSCQKCHMSLPTQQVDLELDCASVRKVRMSGNQCTACCTQGLKLHAAFRLSFILSVLEKHGLVTPAVAQSVTAFIAANQTFGGSSASMPAPAPTPARVARYPPLLGYTCGGARALPRRCESSSCACADSRREWSF